MWLLSDVHILHCSIPFVQCYLQCIVLQLDSYVVMADCLDTDICNG